MRLALISDIHANLPALEAVLADIERRQGRRDLSPRRSRRLRAVAERGRGLIRDRGIPGVSGNYDSTVATNYTHCGCRAENPKQEAQAHLVRMDSRARVGGDKRVPGEPSVPNGCPPARRPCSRSHHHSGSRNQTLNTVYVTEDRPDDFLSKMASDLGLRPNDAVCFGHTHKPWHRVVGGINFINTGSVGRPKDGDPRACYVILSAGEAQIGVEFKRVEYEVKEAVAASNAAGLPEEFADQLQSGSSG